jgi:hypothetical protein
MRAQVQAIVDMVTSTLCKAKVLEYQFAFLFTMPMGTCQPKLENICLSATMENSQKRLVMYQMPESMQQMSMLLVSQPWSIWNLP